MSESRPMFGSEMMYLFSITWPSDEFVVFSSGALP